MMVKILRGVEEDTPITWKTLSLFLQKRAGGVSKENRPGISRNASAFAEVELEDCSPFFIAHLGTWLM